MPKRPFWLLSGVTAAAAVSLVACLAVLAAEPKKDAPNEPETNEPADKDGDAKKGDDEKAGEDGDAKKGGDEEKAGEDAQRPAPHPDLAPGEVVRIVVDALKRNDDGDRGIAITFDFASPGNQEVTGPLARFIPLVKSPAYAPMLNHKSAEYGKVVVREDRARQYVLIVDADGNEAAYVFVLSKQADGDKKGCWMTDGVVRVQPGEEPKLDDPADDPKIEQA